MSEIQFWTIDRLTPYEKNAKKHPPEQIKALAKSIKEFGFDVAHAIEVDAAGVIINGHGRRLAALEANLDTVPIRVRDDLSEQQIRAYRLVDNQVARTDFDVELLVGELKSLHLTGDFDMTDYFDSRELDFSLDELGGMDMGALIDDLEKQVEATQSDVDNRLEKEKQESFPLSDVFTFRTVNAEQRRALIWFQGLAEGVTKLEGAEALAKFISSLIDDHK